MSLPGVRRETAYTDRFDAWPEWERGNAYAVEACESNHGQHPATYDLSAPNGGVMQINKAVWAEWFLENYGWDWATIVLDDVMNHKAARIIWDRNGWGAWACAYVLY